MKLFVGLKEEAKPIVFEGEIETCEQIHPHCDVIYGPFKK